MNNQIQNVLIKTVCEKVLQEKNLAVYLAGKLALGRESVYRRLRGEIYFTFEGIVALLLDLDFSIDNIIGTQKNENAFWGKIRRGIIEINKRERQAENEELRSYTKTTNKLANTLTHKRTATKKEMMLCTSATLAFINFIGVLEDKF